MKVDIETIRRREKAYGGPKRPSTKDEMAANKAARLAVVWARRAADAARARGEK